jgi:hypothetical protein
LAQLILWEREFKFVQKKEMTLLQREIIAKKKSENAMKIFRNLPLQNQMAKFNQTWNKLSLGERNSGLFKERAMSSSKGR